MHAASTAGKKADLPNSQRTIVDLKVREYSELKIYMKNNSV